ncbi:MAG: hypothetical protein JSS02_24055 [Planctomycetes bacterium]|nr:hypothetical protein [Planctomycetota bacterium]
MSLKSAAEPRNGRPWSLAFRLTAYYAFSAFGIVALATAAFCWPMIRNIDQEADQTLRDKIRLLQAILQVNAADEAAIHQEVNESWQAGQHTVVFIRVASPEGLIRAESPSMTSILPIRDFPPAALEWGRGSDFEVPGKQAFRVMSAAIQGGGFVHVALDRTAEQEQELLARFEEGLWYALAGSLIA